ncbi:transglycosylase SLT domain-containing protein [Nocardia sp. NPDC057668]|uniref:transglycosylase SLT domain-containing protein n=1 Tax=Nocardia sp. NPDC057668 TaxID=3346202 RepID=UPI0036720E19
MALTTMAGQFGTRTTPPRPPEPLIPYMTAPASAPSDGGLTATSRYQTIRTETSTRADALAALDTDMLDILGAEGRDGLRGSSAIQSLIAEVNAAVTALGTVDEFRSARTNLTHTLIAALARAESILGHARYSASMRAALVNSLVERYLERTAPRPSRPALLESQPGVATPLPVGTQRQWIDQALRVLAANGYDTRSIDPALIGAIIEHESSGNPHAINLWDSNAAAGTPSKGLMQTIDSTFAAHALPGHTDIWNPVDNIIAGVRYSIDRYGSVDNVPGIAALRSGGRYVGY